MPLPMNALGRFLRREETQPAASDPTHAPSNRWVALGLSALLVTAGLLVYANSFSAPFVLDDILAATWKR